jgi:hypothetical protein
MTGKMGFHSVGALLSVELCTNCAYNVLVQFATWSDP